MLATSEGGLDVDSHELCEIPRLVLRKLSKRWAYIQPWLKNHPNLEALTLGVHLGQFVAKSGILGSGIGLMPIGRRFF